MTDQVDIHLSGCSKTFAGVTVLDDVSLKVLNGEFVTVLGPSGCGKTTTLRVIGGFITPDDGDVHIKGKLVTKLPPYLRNIGVVFQNYALWPHMTVAENLGFGLRIRKLPREEIAKKVERALGLVRLTGLQHRYPRELSGGQQQRSLGVTMLFVTHDQEEALSMSDKVIVMSHGRIQQMDDPRTTYERPATSFVAGFLGNANFVDGEIVEIRSPDRAVARIARGGVAEVVTPAPTSVGAKVRVVIRPEWLHVARAGTTVDANTLPGVVREVIYEGASMRYGVALSSASGLAPGDEVSLNVRSAVVVRPD